jgi:hypothetical protein
LFILLPPSPSPPYSHQCQPHPPPPSRTCSALLFSYFVGKNP